MQELIIAGVFIVPNTVMVGEEFTLSVTVLPNTHGVLRNFTHAELSAYTHQQLSTGVLFADPEQPKPVDKTQLQAVINTASGKKESDYTSLSWEQFISAYYDADAVMKSENVTQADVDGAIASLNSAMSSLVLVADKTALISAIDAAMNKVEEEYTPNSWSAFKAVLYDAISVREDMNASQTEVNSAVTSLNNAVNSLVLRANKSALISKIAEANTKAETDYTPNSWSALQTALSTANAVADDANASQTTVNNAVSTLNSAITNLVPRADKTLLRNLIQSASALDESAYTPNSWSALQNTITNANTLVNDLNASQTEVNSMVSALNNAIDALVQRANKAQLLDAINEANAKNQTSYTPNSWALLADALADANSVYNDLNATQISVDNAETALNNAMSSLVLRANKTALVASINTANSKVETSYTPNSWTPFQTALNTAKSVNSDLNASQSAVDSANNALVSAMNNLVSRANKTALNGLIATADGLSEIAYTPESWATMQTALSNAKDIAGDLNASQTDVDGAYNTLNNAINGLIEIAPVPTGVNLLLASDRTISSNGQSATFNLSISEKRLQGLTITVSADVNMRRAYGNGSTHRVVAEIAIRYADGTIDYCTAEKAAGAKKNSTVTYSGRISATLAVKDKAIQSLSVQPRIAIENINNGTVSIGRPKLEVGSSATAWAPAPED